MNDRTVTIVVTIPEEIESDQDASTFVIETVSDLLTPYGDPIDPSADAYYFVTDRDVVKDAAKSLAASHNATGITLTDWPGPRDLTMKALPGYYPISEGVWIKNGKVRTYDKKDAGPFKHGDKPADVEAFAREHMDAWAADQHRTYVTWHAEALARKAAEHPAAARLNSVQLASLTAEVIAGVVRSDHEHGDKAKDRAVLIEAFSRVGIRYE